VLCSGKNLRSNTDRQINIVIDQDRYTENDDRLEALRNDRTNNDSIITISVGMCEETCLPLLSTDANVETGLGPESC